MSKVWSKKVDEIVSVGYNLEENGIRNWALNKNKALQALLKFRELGIAVLGGDVYEYVNNFMESNYDSWYCDKLINESDQDFLHRSIDLAENYIQNYQIRNSTEIHFAIIPYVVDN